MSIAAALMNFEIAAPMYGLKHEWQGRSFVIDAQAFRLFGVAAVDSSRCVVVQHIKTRKLHRMYPASVIRAFDVKAGA